MPSTVLYTAGRYLITRNPHSVTLSFYSLHSLFYNFSGVLTYYCFWSWRGHLLLIPYLHSKLRHSFVQGISEVLNQFRFCGVFRRPVVGNAFYNLAYNINSCLISRKLTYTFYSTTYCFLSSSPLVSNSSKYLVNLSIKTVIWLIFYGFEVI